MDTPAAMIGDPLFDIFEWHAAYEKCQRFFLDKAQHDGAVHAITALLNIQLPFQWSINPVLTSSPLGQGQQAAFQMPNPYPGRGPVPMGSQRAALNWVSLVPYIRRLVVTGFDGPPLLHGIFGDEWKKGVGPLVECERRNYLFAAKSVGWAKVKAMYDMGPLETVPFIRPIQSIQLAEIEAAERTWGEWLAMEDWMVGPRAPETMDAEAHSTRHSHGHSHGHGHGHHDSRRDT